MRIRLDIDDELLGKAARLTGIKGRTALIHAGLEALILRENNRRLAEPGGTEKRLTRRRRRRPSS
ncbi:MAG: hypothetical protein AMXMBFR13_22240 [Phycisphaerae bacterium]